MTKYLNAYSFRSHLSLPEIHARARAVTAWRWIERDSDRFGAYISARALPQPDYGFVKIFAAPEGFAINVDLESEQPNSEALVQAARAAIFETLLPALEATAIVETDMYE